MRVQQQFVTGGGIAATAAITSARLGHNSELYSRIGDDRIGDEIYQRLLENDVDVKGVRRFPDSRSPQGTIIVDPQGERMCFGFMGEGWTDDASWLDMKLRGIKAVLADYVWYEGASAIFKAGRDCGAQTVLDADINDIDSVRRLLPQADHVVFSEKCLAVLTGYGEMGSGLRAAATMARGHVSVTAGERGFYWLDGDRLRHLPAFQIKAVDTNGAGDVFHGAYTVAIGEGKTIEDAAKFASATAALKCLKGSGWDSIPNRLEVKKFLRGAAS